MKINHLEEVLLVIATAAVCAYDRMYFFISGPRLQDILHLSFYDLNSFILTSAPYVFLIMAFLIFLEKK